MEQNIELSVAECRDLLETDTVGRIAFTTPRGPRIVPVNYALAGDVLMFRTRPYSELATYAPGTQVAFEIDHLDAERKRGWSVVAHGLCQLDDQPEPGPHAADPEPWAGEDRPLRLRLAWRGLSGRRVGSSFWPYPPVSGRGRPY